MKPWKQVKKTNSRSPNSRIKLIMAIIFLLGGSVITRLFFLQVFHYDLYITLASQQQQIYRQLPPRRGRIFFQDKTVAGSGLYPVATNKNYASLYAVPKDVKEVKLLADQLYAVFQRNKIEQEVDELLQRQEQEKLDNELSAISSLSDEERSAKEREIRQKNLALINDKHYQELKEITRQEEINLRKDRATQGYLKILNKGNDPYEPLEQKVEEETLKKFYVDFAVSRGMALKPEQLSIKNNLILVNINNKATELTIDGLGFFISPYRYYPEGNIGANLIGFVGFLGDEERGRYGLEGFFDQELYGKPGVLKGAKDARGEAIILDNQFYDKPLDGGDLILTIDRSIQFTACQKLNQAVARHGADGGSVIIMEPKSGAIIAMCSSPDFDLNNYQQVKGAEAYNNAAIFSQYEPGSIFKVITMAMGIDQGKITPQTAYNDTGEVKIANYTITNSDHKSRGVVNMIKVLEDSLNTGAIFVMRRVGTPVFEKYIADFGFGEKTGIELEGESKGDTRYLINEKKNKELVAATASFGQGIAVTPLQILAAFATIANDGIMMKPYVVKEIIRSDGSKTTVAPRQIRRVISEKTAAIIGGMMVKVVENGHGKRAGVKGYWVGGKTGTAQVPKKDGRGYESNNHIGSFAGFAPADDPRFVMLVRIDRPRDVDWAESSAAPLFGDIADFILNYWQVPQERK